MQDRLFSKLFRLRRPKATSTTFFLYPQNSQHLHVNNVNNVCDSLMIRPYLSLSLLSLRRPSIMVLLHFNSSIRLSAEPTKLPYRNTTTET
jgi:hypothetical protein